MNTLTFAHTGHEHASEIEAAVHSPNNTLAIGIVTVLVIVALAGAFRLMTKPETQKAKEDDEA